MEIIRDKIYEMLDSGDLRSINQSNNIVELIDNQEKFDILFNFLYHDNRLIVMRTADSIEKISRKQPSYLNKYNLALIELCGNSKNKELKWHLAQIVARLNLNSEELEKVFIILKKWLLDKNESKIVRVNSLQTLFEISRYNEKFKKHFDEILDIIKKENISSLNARIKKLR